MTAKETHIIQHLQCPNCGRRGFSEVCHNSAITLLCDCGLRFNFMPELMRAEIVHDPCPDQPPRRPTPVRRRRKPSGFLAWLAWKFKIGWKLVGTEPGYHARIDRYVHEKSGTLRKNVVYD